jgi:hypothetical protein
LNKLKVVMHSLRLTSIITLLLKSEFNETILVIAISLRKLIKLTLAAIVKLFVIYCHKHYNHGRI